MAFAAFCLTMFEPSVDVGRFLLFGDPSASVASHGPPADADAASKAAAEARVVAALSSLRVDINR